MIKSKINKKHFGFFLITMFGVLFACKQDASNLDSILEGKATVHVDESIFPIVEDEQLVFETQYKAKLTLVSKSENEVLNDLFDGKATIGVLSRSLTDAEQKSILNKRKITPKITPFALDGVAFVSNKSVQDTLINLEDVAKFINGEEIKGIKGLVFDNLNSSVYKTLLNVIGLKNVNQKNIFSFKTSKEVINYVAENDGMIGVVGINWMFQPTLDLQDNVDKLNIMSVKGIGKKEYVYPSQDNLAKGIYPLARDLYIINCQGYSGLGMGFASFVAGERGQRIILKSGLVPENFPSRKIVTRPNIVNIKN